MHIQHGGCIMAEKMTLEVFFFFLERHHDQAKSLALSPLLGNCNQYFHNIAALSATWLNCDASSRMQHLVPRSIAEQKEVGGDISEMKRQRCRAARCRGIFIINIILDSGLKSKPFLLFKNQRAYSREK